MATYEIVSSQGPYHEVRVVFADQEFPQLIVTSKTGAGLDSFLQDYSDTYESDWWLNTGVVNVENG
jgi:hypothetical protein